MGEWKTPVSATTDRGTLSLLTHSTREPRVTPAAGGSKYPSRSFTMLIVTATGAVVVVTARAVVGGDVVPIVCLPVGAVAEALIVVVVARPMAARWFTLFFRFCSELSP